MVGCGVLVHHCVTCTALSGAEIEGKLLWKIELPPHPDPLPQPGASKLPFRKRDGLLSPIEKGARGGEEVFSVSETTLTSIPHGAVSNDGAM